MSSSISVMPPEMRRLAKRVDELYTLRDQDVKHVEQRFLAEQQSREGDLMEIWARLELIEQHSIPSEKSRSRSNASETPSSILASILETEKGDGEASNYSAELEQLQKLRDEVEAGRQGTERNKAVLDQAGVAMRYLITEARDAVRALSDAVQKAEGVQVSRLKASDAASRNDIGAGGGQDGGDLQAQVDRLAMEVASLHKAVKEANRQIVTHAMLATRAGLRASSFSLAERRAALEELDMRVQKSGIRVERLQAWDGLPTQPLGDA